MAVIVYYLLRPVLETVGAAAGLVVADTVKLVVGILERIFS